MKKPFFTLSRKLLESDMWLSEKFTKGQAWVDLIGLANWRDKTAIFRGIEITVKRGECARSEIFLAKRWGWSRGRVRRFLNGLEIEQQIKQQKNNVTTLIHLINYDQYQLDGTANSTGVDTANGTRKGEEKNKRNIECFSSDCFPPELLNGWNITQLQKTIDGIISTRKTQHISTGVLQKEFDYWKQYPDRIINAALQTYTEGRFWEQGKDEKYLRGIIRGKDKAVQKESNQTLFQKGF